MAKVIDDTSDWKRSCPAQNGVSITNETECRSACSNLNVAVERYEAKKYSDCPRCWFENSDCRWNTNSKAKEECPDTRQEVCKEGNMQPMYKTVRDFTSISVHFGHQK